MAKFLTKEEENGLIKLYTDQKKSIEIICRENNISEKRFKRILSENNVKVNGPKNSDINTEYRMSVNSRFICDDDHKFVAVLKQDETVVFDDYLNKAGTLTNYIKKKLGIEVPSLFLRKKYFKENGSQWYEQWFDVRLIKKEEIRTKKCPYCTWETTDIENRSGAFVNHLRDIHNKAVKEYLVDFPNDTDYFKKQIILIKRGENGISCPICNKKLTYITRTHIENVHNIPYKTFRTIYPNIEIMTQECHDLFSKNVSKGEEQLNKNALIKKYGFDPNMTETEMAKQLGYDRIWNCGLIKYIWRKENEEK